MFSYETRRDGLRVIGLGVASFLTIFPLCVWRHLEIIESDLLQRSEQALQTAGIETAGIVAEGRDIHVSATPGDPDLEQVAEILGEVYGVRAVYIRQPGGEGAD